jgi:antitoxin (DNA-binding transcriptional repressor) of toxin-antitoxin stability system
MKVSAQYAKEHFADLLTAADSGEERDPLDLAS